MLIVVGNVFSKVVQCADKEDKLLSDILTVPVPGHRFMPTFKNGLWDGMKQFYSSTSKTFPTGFIPFVLEEARKHKYEVVVQDNRHVPALHDPTGIREKYKHLRSYQVDGLVKTLTNSITVGTVTMPWQRGVLKYPTGAGKTILAACLIDFIHKKTLYVVERRELMYQTHDAFKTQTQMSLGLIGDNKWELDADITFAMAQTVRSKFKQLVPFFKRIETLVIDEVQHLSKGIYHQIAVKCPSPFRFGFSATPMRRGDLGDVYLIADTGEIIAEGDREEIQNQGFLAKPKVYIFTVDKPVVNGISYKQAYQSLIVENDYRNEMIITAVQKLRARDCSILILVRFVEHGKILERMVKKKKIPCLFIKGADSMDIRELAKQEIGKSYHVLISTGIFDEGIDCLDPETEVLTQRGWLDYGKLRTNDTVMTLNLSTGEGQWCSILRKFRRELKDGERCVRFKTQHFDYITTENHDFIIADVRYKMENKISSKRVGPWIKEKAKYLASRESGRLNLPISVFGPQTSIPLSDDEIRFIAWLYTDGGIERDSAVIRQSPNSPFCTDIRSLLSRLGFKYYERLRTLVGFDGTPQCYEFKVGKRQWYDKLSIYVKLKGFSDKLLDMSKHQFEVFWHEAIKADGSAGVKWQKFNMPKSPILCNDNEFLLDQLQSIAARNGFASKKSHTHDGHFTLRVREASVMETIYSASRNNNGKRFDFTEEEPLWVWCLTTETGTIVTRRKGSVLVLGNCPILDAGIMAGGGQSRIKSIQRAGRVLRPKNGGKNEVYIIDFKDLTNKYLFTHSSERLRAYEEEGFSVKFPAKI